MFEILRGNKMRVVQGDTAVFNITLSNHAFVPGDLVYFTLKSKIEDTEITLQKIVDNFEDSKARFVLSKEDTGLPVGNYIYDIQLSLSDGRVDTVVLPSKFEVIGGVTP